MTKGLLTFLEWQARPEPKCEFLTGKSERRYCPNPATVTVRTKPHRPGRPVVADRVCDEHVEPCTKQLRHAGRTPWIVPLDQPAFHALVDLVARPVRRIITDEAVVGSIAAIVAVDLCHIEPELLAKLAVEQAPLHTVRAEALDALRGLR